MKTVLITGASRGLGLALAHEFSVDHRLILHCRQIGVELPQSIQMVGPTMVYGDLTCGCALTFARLEKAAKTVGLDVLINNAGVYLNYPFDKWDDPMARQVVETNLIVPMLLTKRLWSVFKEQKSGLVINISSLAANAAGPGESFYAASKAGLSGWTGAMQYEASKIGVSLLNVHLGAMITDITNKRDDQDLLIDPEEVAAVIHSLVADYCSLRITDVTIKRRNY